MTIDRDHDIYLIAESTNRKVIEDMIRSLGYLDTVDGSYKTTDGKYVLVLWNTERTLAYPVMGLTPVSDGQVRARPVSP